MSHAPAEPIAVALGSNLGDRAAQIDEAVRRLRDHVEVGQVSRLYETAPVGWGGGSGVPWFLNAVCVGKTELSPHVLLTALQEIESALGRGPQPGLQPRPIDLDLILQGQRIVWSPTLVLPHPRFRERPFVLIPLSEVAPDWVDPVTGRTVAELARVLRGWEASVRVFGDER